MAGESDDPRARGRDADREGRIAEIFEVYVERISAGESIEIDEILSEHPDLGPEFVEELELLQAIRPGGATGGKGPVGTLGDYELLREIGRGGMGIVYEAHQISMDRRVALKVLPSSVAAETKTLARFLREARIAGSLQHPSIVAVHGMGVEQNIPYYAMEFVEGETLARGDGRLRGRAAGPSDGTDRIDLESCLRIARAFADVAEGLHHAHERGIIHRDIKPSNLILDRKGRLRILDFGLARMEGHASLTLTGDLVGTPLYMSPEQAQARKVPIDHRTDIYSLGATLYRILAGRPPFEGKSHQDTLSQIIAKEAAPLRGLDARIPRDLETIAMKCLEKDPRDRYGTAEATAQDLRRFERGDPIEARPRSVWDRTARSIWRHRIRVTAATGVVILILLAAVLAREHLRDLRREREEIHRRMVTQAVMALQAGRVGMRLGRGRMARIDEHTWVFERDPEGTAGQSVGSSAIDRALASLAEAAELLPERPEACYHRARGYWFRGDAEGGLREAERALARDPRFVPAITLRATMLQRAGDAEGAARELAQARAAADRPQWETWISAYAAMAEGQWEEAARLYRDLTDREAAQGEIYLGSSIETHLGRGLALLEMDRLDAATSEFARAEALWPMMSEPTLLLAKAEYLRGNESYGSELLSDARLRAASGEERGSVVIEICAFYESLWELDEAVEFLGLLEDPFLRERARAYYLVRLGECEDAVRAAHAAIAMEPDDPLANAFLAMSLSCSPETRHLAERPIERALAAGPTNAHVAFIAAWVYAALGRHTLEEAQLLRAGELEPDRYLHHPNLAEMLWAQGRISEAIDCFRAWIERHPADAFPRMELSKIEASQGEIEAALVQIREAIAAQPTYGPAHERQGELLWRKGRREEAEAAYRAAIDCDPKGRWISAQPFFRLAEIYEERTQVAEGLRVLEIASGKRSSGWHGSVFEAVCRRIAEIILRHETATLWAPLDLDRIAEAIREKGGVQQANPSALAVLALAHLRGRAKKDPAEALQLAERAKEGAEPDDPLILATLAETLSANSREAEAIRTLERAVELPDAPLSSWDRLARIRAARGDDPVSFTSIDAALSTWDATSEKDAAYLARVREKMSGDDAREKIAYLEGRLAQRTGEHATAVEIFERLGETGSPEPIVSLRLAESLRASGRASEAERVLRETIEGPCAEDVRAWALWLSVHSADLGQHAMEILAYLPAKPGPDGTRSGMAADVAWMLEQLVTGAAIRINAGGADLIDEDGRTWGEDRFFVGGAAKNANLMESVSSLYRTRRSFCAQDLGAAYRIPLPAGRYEVALHVAECYFDGEGLRRYGVRIQGTEIFRAYDPNASAGFGKPDSRASGPYDVRDGLLRIDFIPEIDNPMVSGIEIIRLRQ
ncbi:MAG: tetratricopeptide repeat protein [Planctomycetes bacterium]|nr:tetratricopeptide repeat protein [Planctomycetota bacterium]